MDRPVALDICCGLGGWASGLIDAGFHVIGVDIEDMFAALGEPQPEHFELVLADICNIRGADYAHVSLIVGSSPCQEFSFRAMPWKRSKARMPADIGLPTPGWWSKPETKMDISERAEWAAWKAAYPVLPPALGMKLFNEQFRIQREICEAKGEHVPLVVENVRGAQRWVGPAAGSFGSYFLFGDVPALMPQTVRRTSKNTGGSWFNIGSSGQVICNNNPARGHGVDGTKTPGFRFDGSGRSFQTASVEGQKAPTGTRWFNDAPRTPESLASSSSKSSARKAASARIARIPFALSSWIGAVYLPRPEPHP